MQIKKSHGLSIWPEWHLSIQPRLCYHQLHLLLLDKQEENPLMQASFFSNAKGGGWVMSHDGRDVGTEALHSLLGEHGQCSHYGERPGSTQSRQYLYTFEPQFHSQIYYPSEMLTGFHRMFILVLSVVLGSGQMRYTEAHLECWAAIRSNG